MSEASDWLGTQLPAMEAALGALVEINSFTANRDGGQRVVRLLEDVFAMPGLDGERIGSERFADHLIFRSAGKPGVEPIALIGHLDTVFPPGSFEGYRVDGNLRRGPGVLDMKGGLVVIAWALKAIASTVGLNAIAPVRLVIVSDEEVGSPEGAPLLRHTIAGSQLALVFESGRANDAIVTQRKGTGSAKAVAIGKPAHAGNAYWEGANAIWALSRFVDCVQSLSSKETGVTVNVGVINGGTSKNTVPAEARAELDLRFPTRALADELWVKLHHAAQSLAVEGVNVKVEPGAGRMPMEKLPGTDALVARYATCAKSHGLAADEAPRQGGGSDGNTAAAMGIPTIDALGPRGKGFHTPDEYIEVDTLISRAQALADFLLSP
ncbi:MAG: M20 family metallopeptidase [Archangium sp.]|nr:M20 family metallopeptidase [Archangium sp.]MDP3569126.1 M20 family metallopeptidase [Archangium sp.]